MDIFFSSEKTPSQIEFVLKAIRIDWTADLLGWRLRKLRVESLAVLSFRLSLFRAYIIYSVKISSPVDLEEGQYFWASSFFDEVQGRPTILRGFCSNGHAHNHKSKKHGQNKFVGKDGMERKARWNHTISLFMTLLSISPSHSEARKYIYRHVRARARSTRMRERRRRPKKAILTILRLLLYLNHQCWYASLTLSLTLSFASLSAPASTRTCTVAVWPNCEAIMSAVEPSPYTHMKRSILRIEKKKRRSI